MQAKEKCLACNVHGDKCTHIAYKAVCVPCEYEDLRRIQPKAVMCPTCSKWLEYVKLEVGVDGYW